MKIKCDACIHRRVCRIKPNESYPQKIRQIASENCKHFIHENIRQLAQEDSHGQHC